MLLLSGNSRVMTVLRLLVSLTALLLSSCGGGGSDSGSQSTAMPTPPPAVASPPAPAPPASVDNRIPFTAFAYDYALPSGPLTVRYQLAPYQASSEFPSISPYRIDDFGFFQVVTEGLNPGCPREQCFEEYAAPGPWNHRAYQILSSDINGDGVEDFYLFEWIHGTREPAPDDLAYAFINDGHGHFKLANQDIFASGKACLHQGGEFPTDSSSKSKLSECGYTAGVPRHILVADFNGDGMDDIFAGMALHLSDAGKLYNRTLTHLPEYFRSAHMSFLFAHDQIAGDVDGDGDLDIFIPSIQHTEKGLWGDGTPISGCAECIATVPWSVLINDGTGSFTLNQNLPILGVGADHPLLVDYLSYSTPTRGILWAGGPPDNLWVTTTAIADFDGDGFGDIAVGWFNPSLTDQWGFPANSLGMVYFNDGQNNWTTRTPIALPANWYDANGNANDMITIDFDSDGWVDIVVASTKQNPYYEGRVIQFFRNQQDGTFVDVTEQVHPTVGRYENGTGTPLWNGEGQLFARDFDGDGDLDIIDTVSETYVLINDGTGVFELKQHSSFPAVDRNASGLWPININNHGSLDFIGYRTQCDTVSCTTNYYQVVD